MSDTHILDSEWLLYMLQKASSNPQGRMLALFDILHDWSRAPSINSSFSNLAVSQTVHTRLREYMIKQGNELGAHLPQMLADQVCLMAVTAMQQELQYPESASLSHAKLAAKALIAVQTKKEYQRYIKPKQYVASLAATLVLGVVYFSYSSFSNSKKAIPAASIDVPTLQVKQANVIADPAETAALFAEIERMRHGSCQLIEAIQLPDAYKQLYFDNIVSGQISTNPEEQKTVRELLKMVRCNYTPMLMANSTG